MKLTAIALAVLALASCSTAAPSRRTERVQVTDQAIAAQAAGGPYVVDLTRVGTVYEIAPGIDASRVRVRTSSQQEIPLTEFVSRMGRHAAGERLLLGSSLDDIIVAQPGDAVAEASCDKKSGSCSCTGRKDCSDLSKSGKCKSGPTDAGCWTTGSGAFGGCICAMK